MSNEYDSSIDVNLFNSSLNLSLTKCSSLNTIQFWVFEALRRNQKFSVSSLTPSIVIKLASLS